MAGTVDIQVAGARLRQMREGFSLTAELRPLVPQGRTHGLTIEEVVILSGNELSKSVISKLERGEIKAPSMEVLTILGRIYHMSPNDMAQLFGLWEPIIQRSADDRRVKRFLQQVDWYRNKGSFKAEVLLNALEADAKMVDELPD